MPQKLYALLVGINDYPPEVGKLTGCLNDVEHVHQYLTSTFDAGALAVEVLKDADATRDNIIGGFRNHLCRATEHDAAVFVYCGHGARWATAPEFGPFYAEKKDEGLVCIDSRLPGGFDLADKELAVLISEVAAKRPHLAVILDCCHSGSGTRGVDAFRGLRPRLTTEVTTPRPLDSYLNGYYAELQRRGERLVIPASAHILLAACERTQLAQEMGDRSGVFTSTLLEVLSKSGGDLTYADLFVRCRAAVRSRADDQDPQFEAFGAFSSRSGFLGRTASFGSTRYSVSFERGRWNVECGAVHGVPAEPDTRVTLALYAEDDQTHLAGTATTTLVGPQTSELALAFTPSSESARYRAEITSLPVAPLLVWFDAPSDQLATLQHALDTNDAGELVSCGVLLTDVAVAASYALAADGGSLVLTRRDSGRVIQRADATAGTVESLPLLRPALKQIGQWTRSLALGNPGTRLDQRQVDFVLVEEIADGTSHEYSTSDVTLDFVETAGTWKNIFAALKVRNRTPQVLHVVLAYFSDAFGVRALRNEPIPPGSDFVTLWGDAPDDYFCVPDGLNESLDQFKLIVSTDHIDDFLLTLDDLELGATAVRSRALGSSPGAAKKIQNDWFTRDLRVLVVRRSHEVGPADTALADNRVLVRKHEQFTAGLSLTAVRSDTRSAGTPPPFYRAFERQGMALVNFSGTRGSNESVLELTNIRNASSLKDSPLTIDLNIPLGDDEGILPLVYDGEHVLLAGHPHKIADGVTRITIGHIPSVADTRRGLGASLKLYFFKTWLRQENLNQLRWVDYRPDGSFEYRTDTLADSVSGARHILVLIHGIIGDTEGIARGIRTCGLDRSFDLVLTYDYENLSTPIADTARALKAQLESAGLHADDGKTVTVLAHSMGGLVSRWFIEREGGNTVVDHLVMCGTPNQGSPFGKVDTARQLLSVLTSVSMNYVPAFIPFSSAALMLLNRTKALTPTLEQMDPESDFITALNGSDDPHVRYTVLAGDVTVYTELGDSVFASLLAKAGQSALADTLFANQAHDIAVGMNSILGVDTPRAILPVRTSVACHHLNYFTSDSGLRALMTVDWTATAQVPR